MARRNLRSDRFGIYGGHPIEKLIAAGGKPGRPRNIETVYKTAYMTNEQGYSNNGEIVRVNDILAYPLYISE